MIYIIKGQDAYLIREKVKEIENSRNDVIRYDGSAKTFSIEEMLESCLMPSLFSSTSIVEVKDPFFFIRKEETPAIKRLLDYCAHPVYECDLLFYTLDERFNERLKTYKDITKNAQVFSLNGYDKNAFPDYARREVSKRGLHLKREAFDALLEAVRLDTGLFQQSLDVLCLYPGELTREAVEALATESDDLDSFQLINAITDKNLSLAIYNERKILNTSNSVLPLISLLAGQLRYLYFIGYLSSKGNSLNDIIEMTHHHQYRISNALKTLRRLSMKEIMSLLKKLNDLDIRIKSDSSIPEKERFELFLVELVNA